MTLSAQSIANWLIDRASCDGEVITNLKVQKLLHIANGWHLHFTDTPLFSEEIQAWRYGPVVPSVYKGFKQFGARSLEVLGEVPKLSGDTFRILESVWKHYGPISAVALVAMTHRPNSPWSITYSGGVGQGCVIDRSLIKEHYAELARKYA